MSYILSALRKAEEERRQGQASVSERMLSAGSEPQKKGLPRFRVIVLAVTALAVFGVVAYRLLTPGDLSLHSNAHQQQASRSEAAVPAPEEKISPRQAQSTEQNSAPPSETIIESAARQQPVDTAEVALPELNITGYIYFESNPDNSKLFVDGVVYRLHSQVVRGLTIEAFHEGYVDVNYRGRPVKLPLP